METNRKKTIGVIGHVDHGKTALTAAILASTKDINLSEKRDSQMSEPPEEKERGMSISEIQKEDTSYQITDPYKGIGDIFFAPVRETRTQRRARERKEKKSK